MASVVVSMVGNGFSSSKPALSSVAQTKAFAAQISSYPTNSSVFYSQRRKQGMMVVRAEGINPEIRKNEDKVVDSVVVTELSKPLTPYCRCWRSGTFPLCDGSHVKHNKATGDNVGPLLLKKQ